MKVYRETITEYLSDLRKESDCNNQMTDFVCDLERSFLLLEEHETFSRTLFKEVCKFNLQKYKNSAVFDTLEDAASKLWSEICTKEARRGTWA